MARAVTSLLYEQDLKRQLGLISSEVEAPASVLRAVDEAAVRGRFSVLSLRDGLYLHMSDTVQVRDHVSSRLLNAGLKLVLVIDGQADMTYGSQRFRLGDGWQQPETAVVRAIAVNLRQATQCVRRGVTGRHTRAISLTVEPAWIGTDSDRIGADRWPVVQRFLDTHLATCIWQPSARILALAGQMLCVSEQDDPIQKLYLESRAIEIVCEAFRQIASRTEERPCAGIALREQKRLAVIREWLDSGEADHLLVGDIARRFGMSASTLQRYFRQSYGKSVFDYLRSSRMERARRALESEAISVAQAAAIAGYASATNFATAMRKRYGLRPSQLKARI